MTSPRRTAAALAVLVLWAATGCVRPTAHASMDGPSSLDVVPAPQDVATTRLRVTQARVEEALALADSLPVLDRVRREVSPSVMWVPVLPGYLMKHSPNRDVAEVQHLIARLKTASRRYLDAAAYQAAVEGLPESAWAVLEDRERRFKGQPHRRLDTVDSLSTRRARLLDVNSASVRAFLTRIGKASLHVRTDSARNVVVGDVPGDSTLGPPVEVARVWSVGPPLTVYATGATGRYATPLNTGFSVPVYRAGRVYGLLSFNAYAGTVMTRTTFGDDLDVSRFPTMTLAEANERVREETGERPTRAVFVDPYGELLLPVPAVLTAEGSVYLVDPVLGFVW